MKNENQSHAKVLEFQKFKIRKELILRESQFVEHDVAELLAESQELLRSLELNPLNADIGRRSQQLIKEILNRLGDLEDIGHFMESHTEANQKLEAIAPFL